MVLNLRAVKDAQNRAIKEAKKDISISDFITKAKYINMADGGIEDYIAGNTKSLNGTYDEVVDGIAISYEYVPYNLISGITVYSVQSKV